MASGNCKQFLRKLKPVLAYNQVNCKKLPGIVFLSGFNSNMNGQKALALESWCKKNGHSYLRFDYSTTGASEGSVASFSDWVEDASDIFSALTSGPQILIGSSMGAYVMLHLHNRFSSRIAGLIGVAPAFYFVDDVKKWKTNATFEDGFFTYPSPSGNYRIPEIFLNEDVLDTVDLFKNDQLLNLQCPLYIYQGMCDDVIHWQTPFKFIENRLNAGSHEVRVTLRKNGDHRLSTDEDLKALRNELAFMISNISEQSDSSKSSP